MTPRIFTKDRLITLDVTDLKWLVILSALSGACVVAGLVLIWSWA